jgi:parvulin-like peptidyl-prolyl isomerase
MCFVIGLMLSTGCGGPKDPGEQVALGVGTREITVRQLERDLKRIRFEMGMNEQDSWPITENLVDRVVDHYLILEYGKKNHVQITEKELDLAVQDIKRDYSEEDFQKVLLEGYIDFEEWREALGEQLLVRKILEKASEKMSPVSFQEIKTYYDTHLGEFRRPQMVKFRQIVLRTEAEAEMVSEKLKKGEDFESLARTHSISPEGGEGGLVDWIGRNHLSDSMAKPLFSLPLGKTSPVVRTEYGFHIFRVLSRRPEGQQSLPESMAQIESKLVYEKQTYFYSEWLEELRTQYPVRKNQDVIETMRKEG